MDIWITFLLTIHSELKLAPIASYCEKSRNEYKWASLPEAGYRMFWGKAQENGITESHGRLSSR